jgi:hypothetical protein
MRFSVPIWQEYFYNYEPPKSKVLSACKSCHALFLFGIVFIKISVADPNYLDADPNADPDPTFHFEADPDADPKLMRMRIRIRIQLITLMRNWMRIRIQLITVMRTRILPLQVDADPGPQHR